MNQQQLEDSLPLCPNCGRWFDPKSENTNCNHGPEYFKYGLTLREIARCKLADCPQAAACLEDDRHVRGTD